MHSPLATHALAHAPAAAVPSAPRKISRMPPITACGSSASPAGSVIGTASTHLPQRVQASSIVSTRSVRAVSNVSLIVHNRRGPTDPAQYPDAGRHKTPRAAYGSLPSGHESVRRGNRLDLDKHRWVGEAGDRDGGAGREVGTENLGTNLRHARGVARIDQKYRHGHDVAELCTGFGEGALYISERLPALGIEIAGQRLAGVIDLAGVPGDPDNIPRPLGDHRRGERALLLPRAANE